MDVVKLLEAIAWPIAVTIVALVVLLITRMVLNKSGRIGVKWKELFSFEADASRQIIDTPQSPHLALVPAAVSIPDASDVSQIETRDAIVAPEPIDANAAQVNSSVLSDLIFAKNLSDLDNAFENMKEEELELEPDFWTTFYVGRKQMLGASGTVEEFEQLAEANPTWVGPITHLLRLAVRSHDTDWSLKLIAQALARRNARNSHDVLTAVVEAYYSLYSADRAFQFFKDQCAQGASSADKAAMLASLASKLSSNKFASRISYEMAQITDPGRKADSFNLALGYSEDQKTWAIGYNAYSEIDYKNDQYVFSLNNRGVLLQDIDKRLSIEFYEQGLKADNAQSASNLARLLINDGYVGVGERLLDTIKDQQDAGEHIASTRASALAARREMQKRLSELQAVTSEEAHKYRAVLARALKMLEKLGVASNGVYAATDSSILILLDGAGAACRLTVGTLNFEGVLSTSSVGYDGFLTSPGAGILGSLTWMSVFLTGPEMLTAVIWPRTKSETDRLRVIDLPQVKKGALSEIAPPASTLLPRT